MSSWRRSTGLVCWALLAFAATGCSTTSLPARLTRLATGQTPQPRMSQQRLVAIGKTFEGQGQYDKATRMYRMVLNRDPGNQQAAKGLRTIAARRSNEGRVFEAPGQMLARSSRRPSRTASMSTPPRPAVRPTTGMIAATVVPPTTGRVSANLMSPETEQWEMPVQMTAATKASAGRTVVALDQNEDQEWALPRVVPAGGHRRAKSEETDSIEQSLAEAGETTRLDACIDDPSSHVDTIVESLADQDPETRTLAAFLLGEAGQDAQGTIPLLKTRLGLEPRESVRVSVAEAIGKIDPTDGDAARVLMQSLKSKSDAARSQAAFALRVLNPSNECVQALQAVLNDSNNDVAVMAALSLSDFGAAARSALPGLQSASRSADQQTREALQAAISRITESEIEQTGFNN